MGGGSSRFVPVGGHVTSKDDDVLHAVDWVDALDHQSKTACGVPASVMMAQGAVLDRPGVEREVVGVALMPWPPYKAQGRCPACWEATGRPRPDQQWRDIDVAELTEDDS